MNRDLCGNDVKTVWWLLLIFFNNLSKNLSSFSRLSVDSIYYNIITNSLMLAAELLLLSVSLISDDGVLF